MKELGKIIHFTKSKLFVIETKERILPGTELFDSKGRKIAISIDLIGPINRPYIVAKPIVNQPNKYVGSYIYYVRRRKSGR